VFFIIWKGISLMALCSSIKYALLRNVQHIGLLLAPQQAPGMDSIADDKRVGEKIHTAAHL
jgi:hypothetical protein